MASVEDAALAAERGDKRKARTILREIMKQEPRNIDAWLLFADVSEKIDDTIHCLRQVLKLDPGNVRAREKLAALGRADLVPEPGPQGPSSAAAEAAPVITSEPANAQPPAALSESQPSAERENEITAPALDSKKCPYCAETIRAQAIYCRFCHRDLRSRPALTVETQYGWLALVAILLKVLGVVVVLGAIIGALGLYSLTHQSAAVFATQVASSLGWLVPVSVGVLGTINGVIFFAFGELINLLIDLEANTRLAAELLQPQNR